MNALVLMVNEHCSSQIGSCMTDFVIAHGEISSYDPANHHCLLKKVLTENVLDTKRMVWFKFRESPQSTSEPGSCSYYRLIPSKFSVKVKALETKRLNSNRNMYQKLKEKSLEKAGTAKEVEEAAQVQRDSASLIHDFERTPAMRNMKHRIFFVL